MLNNNELDGVIILLESASDNQLDYLIETIREMYQDRHMEEQDNVN